MCKLRPALRDHAGIDRAVFFGSRAMGNYKKSSDVDIALIGSIPAADALTLSARLNERLPLPYHFDIVVYGEISNPELKAHIDRHGKTIFERQPADRD